MDGWRGGLAAFQQILYAQRQLRGICLCGVFVLFLYFQIYLLAVDFNVFWRAHAQPYLFSVDIQNSDFYIVAYYERLLSLPRQD
jgi:hypothetical protein